MTSQATLPVSQLIYDNLAITVREFETKFSDRLPQLAKIHGAFQTADSDRRFDVNDEEVGDVLFQSTHSKT